MAFLLRKNTFGTDLFEEIAQRDDIEDLVSVAEHHSGIKPLIWEDYEEGIFGRAFDNDDDHYLITSID